MGSATVTSLQWVEGRMGQGRGPTGHLPGGALGHHRVPGDGGVGEQGGVAGGDDGDDGDVGDDGDGGWWGGKVTGWRGEGVEGWTSSVEVATPHKLFLVILTAI